MQGYNRAMVSARPRPELEITKVATNLDELWDNFDPALAVDPESEFYVHRTDEDELGRLCFELVRVKPDAIFHGFLCGHGGSGKSTELRRLARNPKVRQHFLPIHVSIRTFGKDTIDLTHDALMVEIGLALREAAEKNGLESTFAGELDEWGTTTVKGFLKEEAVAAEAGAKGNAWLAYFKASLRTRRTWNVEQQQRFEPRVVELVAILNRMAQELENRTKRRVLVIVDDLEKGDSEGHRAMHARLFCDHYETLVGPRFATIYTLPVYFRALPDNRIPGDQIYSFAAARLYPPERKDEDHPALDREHPGYQLMHGFAKARVGDVDRYFEADVLDELLLVGGGLFRETARAIRLAAQRAIMRAADRISLDDAKHAAEQIKKDYQPIVRGDAVRVLKAVLDSRYGWVEDVEPYLQWRAVVEYENGSMWLDVRSVLKGYVRTLDGAAARS